MKTFTSHSQIEYDCNIGILIRLKSISVLSLFESLLSLGVESYDQ